VFGKSGLSRQTELARMIASIGLLNTGALDKPGRK